MRRRSSPDLSPSNESEIDLLRPCRVVVAAASREEQVRAVTSRIARTLSLPIVADDNDAADGSELVLAVGANRLSLHERRHVRTEGVFVDFVGGAGGYRRRSSLSRRQPIALAVGLRRGPVTVVDATAGLARDSFLLACLGCTVIAVERSPILGLLIRDGLRRAVIEGSAAVRAVLERLTLVIDDARSVLREMDGTDAPEVVYLDPMYPPKKKKALVKKEMRICRRLVGDDRDAGELLALARRVAGRRVVVKRHCHAPLLAPRPAMQFSGKLVRYDVYLPTRQSQT